MCQTDVTFWHVASVGTQSDFLSVYFTGNMFQYQGLYQSVLTLFPMTAITLPMETDLIGKVIGQHLQRESAVVIAGTNSFVKYCSRVHSNFRQLWSLGFLLLCDSSTLFPPLSDTDTVKTL